MITPILQRLRFREPSEITQNRFGVGLTGLAAFYTSLEKSVLIHVPRLLRTPAAAE